ncbi:hypothetical protein SPRG_02873 [Saprolegnia parasitica CBS 223.65]|uniref:ATP-dependent RNA helicase n=1 Tax=Saprolegnia parasitica (strain CBS 223.65) TaxID=695850 RepID=A0A067D0V1_SAPPC|nr:hypothetical protein SPRG_02873 [Saprolegnia parasitica CBS 223.65]KDO32396.1 hypothetical protein SPRG_02873 [Saprolegnia parasitica CBS 223.65]|eukprot:XP_012196850.1 hypothetical protein SPRG_02873 [Saprolegnia parasitica CBS 223.65]
MDSQAASTKPKRNRNHWKRKNKSATDEATPAASPAPAKVPMPKKLKATPAPEILPASEAVGPPPAPARESTAKSIVHLSDVSFKSLSISKESAQALSDVMKYDKMTKVQNETLPIVMQGKDVLAKSKTGTGKTMAFLLPTIETLAKTPRHGNEILALILSPTRELASQIDVEAKKLTTFHKNIPVACMVGGTSMSKDLRKLQQPQGFAILVATPGRLHDHIKNDTGGMQGRLRHVQVLVLDEADRLLDMGFRDEIERILSYLPSARQTLLFSATLPSSLEDMKRLALKKNYEYVDTVGEEDQTNAQVNQSVIVCTLEEHIVALESLLLEHIAASPDGYKIMAFFPTARAAGYMAAVFEKAGFPIIEMHSRKSQSHRTKVAETFRQRDNLIMFSSDVSARGVDYPGVSFIVQVGLTDREQYIHRLGRTGRAGRDGEGILLLSEFEKRFLKDLVDMPMTTRPVPPTSATSRVASVVQRCAVDKALTQAAEQAYQAWLGYYNSNLKRLGLTKDRLVSMAAEYSVVVGLAEVPALQKKTIGKMGLQNMGLRVADYAPPAQNRGQNQNRGPSQGPPRSQQGPPRSQPGQGNKAAAHKPQGHLNQPPSHKRRN